MPQDGSNNYQYPPGTPGIPDTTIESEAYNTFLDDLVINDLNIPRPVHRGGTGASTADAALVNLKAEKAEQVVTAYLSHVWMPGSFRSAAAATDAPVAGHAFAGICYINEPLVYPPTNANVTVEARDMTDGKLYVMTKTAGVWSSWSIDGAGEYVNVTGDTMTGSLILPGDPVIALHAATKQYVDAVDSAKVDRSGDTMTGSLTVTGATTSSIVTVLPPSGNAQLFLQNSSGSSRGILMWEEATNSVRLYHVTPNASLDVMASGAIQLGNGFHSKAGSAGAFSAVKHNFNFTGAIEAWIDTTNVGNIAFTSDYRIKKDVVELPEMWETVKALRPIKYTQAQFSPPSHIAGKAKEAADARKAAEDNPSYAPKAVDAAPLFEADDIERWGFIAHELQETLTPSASTGVKDAPDTIQAPNPFTLIAALTKALQEAMARIEALEAAG